LGILLTDYILKKKKADNSLPDKPLIITTIVSTVLPEKIIKEYGGTVEYVFTGFKNIGEAMNNLEIRNELNRFILDFEESCGYLIGGYCRDKDAVGSSMIISEMVNFYNKQNKDLIDILNEIYKKYIYCESILKSYVFEGEQGIKKIDAIIKNFRKNGIQELAGEKVIKSIDYLPESNVLEYSTKNIKIIIRPSGTEPKLKIYFHIKSFNKTATAIIMEKINNFFTEQIK